MIEWHDIFGIIGVVSVLSAYALLQIRRMSAHGFAFPLINLIGSVLILVSLIYQPNLSAILIETAWAVISIFGLVMAWQARKKSDQS
jgi:hypothetical protein